MYPSPAQPGVLPPQVPRKRHTARNVILIIAGALAVIIITVSSLAAALSGGTPSHRAAVTAPATQAPPATPAATTPSGPAQLNVGDSADITQTGADAATITITYVALNSSPADPQFGSAPQNGDFAIATVTVQTLSGFTGGFDINPLDFYVLSPQGTQYTEGSGNAYDALASPNEELNAATLGAGQNTTGKLVFDVPPGHGGMIVYAPNYDGQPVAEWSY
jgi:hypothetical protein